MKKLFFLYFSASLVLSAMVSCNKELAPEGTAALTIMNAIPGCPAFVTNFSGKHPITWYQGALYVEYGVSRPGLQITIPAKEQPLAIFKYPDTTAADKPIYNTVLHPKIGDISALFMVGSLSQPEALLVTEKPPYYAEADSLMGLRLINLSMGSGAINVKISGQGVNISNNNLAYKANSGYLSVHANSKVGNVKIEVYDQQSSTLLASHIIPNVGGVLTDNRYRNHSFTLAFLGVPNAVNGKDKQQLVLIDDY